MIELTTEQFKEKVFKDNKFIGEHPVLIDFHAIWCSPCKLIAPSIQEIAEEFEGKLDVYKVDIDAEPQLAKEYEVISVPTILFITSEGEIIRVVGAVPKETLLKVISEKLGIE